MAQKGNQLDRETFSCSLCLDILKDPVAIPCGHSYCMSCIKSFWDADDDKKSYRCPQCRQIFVPRPVLVKNTMLAAFVEQLKDSDFQDAAAAADEDDELLYAGPEDVACDVCIGRKLKALKACRVCFVSYCEKHLQPHYDLPAFRKHKLVEPSEKLLENICFCHDEVMQMFCRTDQKCICYLCSVDEHRGHETVTAAEERAEMQQGLEESRWNIQKRILEREEDVRLLQQEAEAVERSADKAVADSEKMFNELIRLIKTRRSDVTQQIRSQQETEVSEVRELQENLEQEIAELKRKDAELKLLTHTEDHNKFIHNYPSLSQLSQSRSSIEIRPLGHFDMVTAAVAELRGKIQDIMREEWTNILLTGPEVNVLLSEAEPKTRAGFLQYSREITLDPNTANACLLLTEGNRKAERTRQQQFPCCHPERFTDCGQVLSNESLTGRCYWEVERRGREVDVAVAYRSISRTGCLNECLFGRNKKSWVLYCYTNSYEFSFNLISVPISGPVSSRVGVYLDHRAGILSFYSVSETMTLLHRVQTTFTRPLYAGVWLNSGATAEFCELI